MQQVKKNSKTFKPNASFYVVMVLIVMVILYGIITGVLLRKKGIILTAKTTEWEMGAKSVSLQYQFYYKGNLVTEDNVFNKFRGNSNFLGRYFPVIYFPGWGGHSQLLIEPEDFKKFNIPFPDSLKWVLPYLRN